MSDASNPGGAGSPAPGYYPDPSGVMRWWDGTRWTDRVQNSGPPPLAPHPPKKSHTVRNILLALVAVGVLAIGGCIAFLAVAANEVNEAIETAEAQDSAPGGPDNPLTITEGQPFEVSGFQYAPGWSVTQDALGYAQIEGLKVTNARGDKDGALVEIKFMDGNEVVALVDCTTEQIPVGQTTSLNCSSGDKFPATYDRITINDTF
ncbi:MULTISPECIES: DUF2510 domain-containing protein [Rhodococcus]|uniref:DUF2510 domain-containing protein n=1 Tax=Rhodococcus TaxID=1827 RepID=UPI0008357353|nr:DUF2510 domain-containing protein [Rhodococcus phenolicus]